MKKKGANLGGKGARRETANSVGGHVSQSTKRGETRLSPYKGFFLEKGKNRNGAKKKAGNSD